MNLRAIFTVWRKELREALRDRRTLISTIVIPTVAMPLLMLAAGTVSMKVVRQARAETPTVFVLGGEDSPQVLAALKAQARLRCQAAPPDWRRRISDKQARVAVEIPAQFDAALARGDSAEVRIFHYQGEMRSGFAVGEVRRFFTEYREEFVARSLRDRGLPPTLVRPFEVRVENVAPPEKVGGNIIGGIIPYMFILLCFSGAMYPAIDLTAGEKERGTLETVLCSPVARLDLVLGKFALVLTASLATVAASLVSMAVSAVVGGALFLGAGGAAALAGTATRGGLGGAGAGGGWAALPMIDPLGLVGVVALVLPLAFLFAALLLAVSLFAKTSKEAQSYTTPLVMVVILPAMMGLLPGVELNARLALVPILNVALASKELLSGSWPWAQLGLIFGSSCLYAGLALAWCVRQFNREDVLFRS